MHDTFTEFATLLLICALIGAVFVRLRQPVLIAYIVAGIAVGPAGFGPGAQRLRDVLRPLDLPRLVRVPAEHVLTKTFYLLQDFPGRVAGAPLWIEQPDARANDGVTSVLIGANDWAAAWALDAQGRAMFAAVPGGEGQRELAVRFGVNLVMYALTGNYKGDQVHVETILERLKR